MSDAGQWGGWGRLSVDGPGQHNLDRSEGPWGRAVNTALTAVLILPIPDHDTAAWRKGLAMESTKGDDKLNVKRYMSGAGLNRGAYQEGPI